MGKINWIKILGIGAGIIGGIATMISNYAEKKQNEETIREISKEVFDEEITKIQEAEYEEFETKEAIA
jgi:hypothetical protein